MAARLGATSAPGRSPTTHRRRRADLVRARDAAVPVGRAAHRPPEELLGRRRRRALPAPHRPPRAAPDGLRRVRPAGREPRDQDRRAPARVGRKSIAAFQEGMRSWGISIDWSREFGTHEPRYYRWTQWIFLKLFERGLAYRKDAAVNWCPKDATVLANEQVIDGRCERCGTPVEVRQLEQWFFRITDYADRLLDDLETLEWPPHVKTMQRNWIGRSEGAEVTFHQPELGVDYPVFTTRPDTLFGATFFVMAPEHPDVMRLAAGTEHEQAVREYINGALAESSEERSDTERTKTGVPLGRTRDQPGQRRADPDVRRRLRADGVRHRRDHGRARARPARLRLRDDVRPADPARRRAGGRRRRTRTGRTPPTPTTRCSSTRAGSPGCPRSRRRTRSSTGSTTRVAATARSTTGCATGCSPASATGAARSRSSTATRAGWCPCPRTSCRWCCPTSRTTCRRAGRRWPLPRTG